MKRKLTGSSLNELCFAGPQEVINGFINSCGYPVWYREDRGSVPESRGADRIYD